MLLRSCARHCCPIFAPRLCITERILKLKTKRSRAKKVASPRLTRPHAANVLSWGNLLSCSWSREDNYMGFWCYGVGNWSLMQDLYEAFHQASWWLWADFNGVAVFNIIHWRISHLLNITKTTRMGMNMYSCDGGATSRKAQTRLDCKTRSIRIDKSMLKLASKIEIGI